MKIFPSNCYAFRLAGDGHESLERLKRRTETSDRLVSKITDKSFIGKVEGNAFRIIGAEIGKGALCVLSGRIENGSGTVCVAFNKAFQFLFSIFYVLPVIGCAFEAVRKPQDTLVLIVVGILQLLMIRFFFIEFFFFRRFSKQSLARLGDVLDVVSMHKI